jgi:hypothetical protein
MEDELIVDDENTAEADAGEVVEDVAADNPEQESGQVEAATDDTPAEDDGEIVVSIGDEKPTEEEDPARAPAWVRDLRKANREKDRRIRELEAKVSQAAPATAAAVVVGEKPSLAGCDYDEDKYTSELEAWHGRKAAAAEKERKAQRADEDARAAWQARLAEYGTKAKALRVPDFEDAEGIVQDSLNVIQQGVILNGAENPALLVYALGKHPGKARELAAIQDPVKFAFAVAKLEAQLKTTPRKAAPAPEKAVRASAGGAAAVENTLARLQAEADKTGDRSKVVAYMRQQRAKQAA